MENTKTKNSGILTDGCKVKLFWGDSKGNAISGCETLFKNGFFGEKKKNLFGIQSKTYKPSEFDGIINWFEVF